MADENVEEASTAPPPQPLNSIRAFLASLLALGKARQIWLLTLVVVGTAAEGVGIFLLVPFGNIMFNWSAPDSKLAQIAQPMLNHFGRENSLAFLLIAFVAMMMVRAFILYKRDTGLFALSSELVDSWRGRMISTLVHAEWRTLRMLNRGDIEFAVTGDVSRLAVGSDKLLRGVVAFVQLSVLVILAAQLAPILSLAAAALLTPAIPLAALMARAAYSHGQTLTRHGGKRHGAFAEFMAGMKLAKAHRAEDRYADEFTQLSDDLRQSSLRFFAVQMRSSLLFQLLAAMLAACLLWTGAVLLKTAPAVLGAVLLLFARMPGPAMVLAQGAQSLAMLLPAIANLLYLERRLATAPIDATSLRQERLQPPEICLHQISHRHDPTRPLLKNVSITLASGQLSVLLGQSGSGKTTLADMIIGLTPPNSGAMTVDGIAIDTPAARLGWRQEIGYVPQDPFLFDRSIADNMRWAAADASDAQIWAALEAADAAGFVRALPEALEARAGDRGGHFSGGERQRLCLARALLRRPALLMLDEATSALDPASEERLLSALLDLRGTTTILMIAHRIPDRFKPDRIYHLADGEVVG